MQHKPALAFQRTLMINQTIERYQACSEESRKNTEEKTYQLWTAYNENERDTKESRDLFRAIRDFYYRGLLKTNLYFIELYVITECLLLWHAKNKTI